MRKEQEMVRQFMRDFDQHLEVVPRMPPQNVQDLAYALIREELEEFREAINENSILKCADAIGDILYTALWAANAFGFDAKAVFDEIHRSNMTKKGGVKSEQGKLLKPSSYSPPKIEEVLIPW